MPVKHSDNIHAAPVTAGSGTSMQVLIGPDEGPHFAMRRFTMAAGGSMPRHTNAVEHEQYVIGGKARIGIGEEEFSVGAGSVVFIPAGVPHWYRTVGDDPFVFLCLVPNLPDTITLVE